MTELFERFFVGEDQSCKDHKSQPDFAIVHACKDPCHKQGVGYSGNLDKNDPRYLVFEDGKNLYLNMIDAPFPMKPEFGNPLFKSAFNFIDENLQDPEMNVLVHCNVGGSRGPSIAMAYLAKKGMIGAISFEHAKTEFKEIYPGYEPGKGIAHYLENNWETVMNL